MSARRLRVLHLGTYDRGVGRNAIVARALREAGHELRACHEPLWRDTADKLRALDRGGPLAAVALARRIARAQLRLARRADDGHGADVVLVGATGHLDLPLARRMADRLDAPLVFDPLISIGETARDRGILPERGPRAWTLRAAERWLFRLPDLVLADTAVHAAAWREELGLPASHSAVLPLGAVAAFRDAPRYAARPPWMIGPDAPFQVLYFGQYIPLHGVHVILEAAERLAHRGDVAFTLVGQGQELAMARELAAAQSLRNVSFATDWLDEPTLVARHVTHADLCLGIFGASPKAARVVPYKVHAALAAGRPVLTADTPAVREQLSPGDELAVVPPEDPERLAAAVLALAADPAARARLAARGREAHLSRFAPGPLGARLAALLAEAVAEHRAAPVGPRHAHRIRRVADAVAPRADATTSPVTGAGGEATPPPAASRTEGAASPPTASAPLLDAGCGDGTLARTLAEDDERPVLAFDLDLDRVRRARARSLRVEGGRLLPFVADIGRLPLPDGSGAATGAAPEAIACGEVLEHVADDARAVTELARVLAPGGRLVLTAPAGPRRFSPIDRAAGHERRYSRDRLEHVVRQAELSVEELRSWGFPFGRLYDRFVQRPALRTPRSRQRALARIATARPVAWLAERLFALDRTLEGLAATAQDEEGRGAGWWLVAKKPPEA